MYFPCCPEHFFLKHCHFFNLLFIYGIYQVLWYQNVQTMQLMCEGPRTRRLRRYSRYNRCQSQRLDDPPPHLRQCRSPSSDYGLSSTPKHTSYTDITEHKYTNSKLVCLKTRHGSEHNSNSMDHGVSSCHSRYPPPGQKPQTVHQNPTLDNPLISYTPRIGLEWRSQATWSYGWSCS